MARIIYDLLSDVDCRGPFPNKNGEFCRNVLKSSLSLSNNGTVLKHQYNFESLGLQKTAQFRIGRPSIYYNGHHHSSNELEFRGYVGLYLDGDQQPCENEAEVDTDIFTEAVVSGERTAKKPFILHLTKGL